MNVVFSFDVEEHWRIEAARGLAIDDATKRVYSDRMETTTRLLLEQLARHQRLATFFIVGAIAEERPKLVRDIALAGHEIANHSHEHTALWHLTPEQFREDLGRSKAALEAASGRNVIGFRAPTFSIDRRTAWAIPILRESGFFYDSSIFPVKHDRYGVPDAPRWPFQIDGLTELPPTTWRTLGRNVPVAGGGYFRLLPPSFMHRGIKQCLGLDPPLAMLYFHPWEFDGFQPRLCLAPLSRWRTYVGIKRSVKRLDLLLERYPGHRACDVLSKLPFLPTGRLVN